MRYLVIRSAEIDSDGLPYDIEFMTDNIIEIDNYVRHTFDQFRRGRSDHRPLVHVIDMEEKEIKTYDLYSNKMRTEKVMTR